MRQSENMRLFRNALFVLSVARPVSGRLLSTSQGALTHTATWEQLFLAASSYLISSWPGILDEQTFGPEVEELHSEVSALFFRWSYETDILDVISRAEMRVFERIWRLAKSAIELNQISGFDGDLAQFIRDAPVSELITSQETRDLLDS